MVAVSDDEKCTAGAYCPGGVGVKADAPKCPAGSYCPVTGAVTPSPCPVGTYSDTEASGLLSDCLACVENFFCPLRGGTTAIYGFSTTSTNAYSCGAGFLCKSGCKDSQPVPGADPSVGGVFCEVGKYCVQEELG